MTDRQFEGDFLSLRLLPDLTSAHQWRPQYTTATTITITTTTPPSTLNFISRRTTRKACLPATPVSSSHYSHRTHEHHSAQMSVLLPQFTYQFLSSLSSSWSSTEAGELSVCLSTTNTCVNQVFSSIITFDPNCFKLNEDIPSAENTQKLVHKTVGIELSTSLNL